MRKNVSPEHLRRTIKCGLITTVLYRDWFLEVQVHVWVVPQVSGYWSWVQHVQKKKIPVHLLVVNFPIAGLIKFFKSKDDNTTATPTTSWTILLKKRSVLYDKINTLQPVWLIFFTFHSNWPKNFNQFVKVCPQCICRLSATVRWQSLKALLPYPKRHPSFFIQPVNLTLTSCVCILSCSFASQQSIHPWFYHHGGLDEGVTQVRAALAAQQSFIKSQCVLKETGLNLALKERLIQYSTIQY